MEAAFRKADTDGDGVISKAEKQAWASLGEWVYDPQARAFSLYYVYSVYHADPFEGLRSRRGLPSASGCTTRRET